MKKIKLFHLVTGLFFIVLGALIEAISIGVAGVVVIPAVAIIVAIVLFCAISILTVCSVVAVLLIPVIAIAYVGSLIAGGGKSIYDNREEWVEEECKHRPAG